MNDNDSKLFREFVGDVEPVKSDRVIDDTPKSRPTPGMLERRRAAETAQQRRLNPLDNIDSMVPVKPRDELACKRDGVQHGVFKKLRQGKYPIGERLDLHRMTVDQARAALYHFIGDCVRRDIRCALITHGRGEGREPPALLKSCVNHWLRQLDAVLAFHSAERHHGGTGATYVLLRKSADKREENRERYSKRHS